MAAAEVHELQLREDARVLLLDHANREREALDGAGQPPGLMPGPAGLLICRTRAVPGSAPDAGRTVPRALA